MDEQTPTTSPKRILVVEDNQMLRELYVTILQAEGYTVDAAADGQAGYEAVIRGGYDLVLLDIMLPQMDGLTILQKANSDTPPAQPNKAYVILSNMGQDGAIAEAVRLGARGYMIKSDYTPGEILDKVKEYLVS